jgi:hypothetical protein
VSLCVHHCTNPQPLLVRTRMVRVPLRVTSKKGCYRCVGDQQAQGLRTRGARGVGLMIWHPASRESTRPVVTFPQKARHYLPPPQRPKRAGLSQADRVVHPAVRLSLSSVLYFRTLADIHSPRQLQSQPPAPHPYPTRAGVTCTCRQSMTILETAAVILSVSGRGRCLHVVGCYTPTPHAPPGTTMARQPVHMQHSFPPDWQHHKLQ